VPPSCVAPGLCALCVPVAFVPTDFALCRVMMRDANGRATRECDAQLRVRMGRGRPRQGWRDRHGGP